MGSGDNIQAGRITTAQSTTDLVGEGQLPSEGYFEVKEQKGGKSNLSFSYRITAKRKDITGERLAKVSPPEAPKGIHPKAPVPPHSHHDFSKVLRPEKKE